MFSQLLPPPRTFTAGDSCAAPSNLHYQHILWSQTSARSPPHLAFWQLNLMWTFEKARERKIYILIIKRRGRKGISNQCTLMPSRKPLGHRVWRKYIFAENCHISSLGYAQNDWLLWERGFFLSSFSKQLSNLSLCLHSERRSATTQHGTQRWFHLWRLVWGDWCDCPLRANQMPP